MRIEIGQWLFWRGTPTSGLLRVRKVYQEVIHRYTSIDRPRAIADAFAVLDDIVAAVFPVTRADVGVAAEIAAAHPGLSSRDCLHLAVMRGHGVHRALTFDRGFTRHPGITVLP